MDARNGLHLATVAMPQAFPVDGFHAPHVGAAVLGDGYVAVLADHAGHGIHPQHFVADVAVHIAVELFENLDGFVQLGGGWGDELSRASE